MNQRKDDIIKKKFIPVLVVIAGITLLTFQSKNSTEDMSRSVLIFTRNLLHVDMSNPPLWAINRGWFRTLCHIPLYCFLGVAVGIWQKKWWKGLLICSIIAVIDETTKVFLPTREFCIVDLSFDAIGFIIGVLLVKVGCIIFSRILKKR